MTTDRNATLRMNSGDALDVSKADAIVTFNGPIVAKSRRTASRPFNSMQKSLLKMGDLIGRRHYLAAFGANTNAKR
jgi:hypothetical protein